MHVKTFTMTVVVGIWTVFGWSMASVRTFDGGTGTRGRTLADSLEVLRSSIEMYRHEHGGAWPAAGSEDPAAFEACLTQPSEFEGSVRGAYVVDRLPANPINGRFGVRVVNGDVRPTPDDTTGWIYDSTTGAIFANTVEVDDAGRRYADY